MVTSALRGFSSGRRLLLFYWVAGALALVSLILVLAWVLESQRPTLLPLAALAGATVGILLMLALHWQRGHHDVASRELANVEARVAGIVESAMDPIIAIDDAQRIVMFNAAAECVFRWPRTAVIGQPLDMLLPERFHAAHAKHIERFGQTGVTSRQMGAKAVLFAQRANAEEFPIEASISQHVEDGKRLFTVILRDIGERVRAEAMLERSEGRLRGILDSAMDAIITIDEKQHVVLFNAAAEAMFMCPRDEAIGAPLAWFIPERFRAMHADNVRQFGDTGVVARRMGSQRIVTGLRRNGEEFPIDASISQVSESGVKLYTVILRDVTERVRAEQALLHSREELRELGSAAHMTREQEKTRIARELHDELGQSLTMLQMDVAWCRERLPAGDDAIRAKFDRMAALLQTSAASTRRIASDLRPLMLDDLGLPDALEWLVQEFSQRTGVPCKLAMGDPALNLPHMEATAVFRIVQEALANIAKHARASHAEVAVESSGGALTIRIRDNGVGFSQTDARKPNSYGLIGLRERASLLNGSMSIVSAPGEGTRIEIHLPLAMEPAT